MSQPTKRHLS